jgi:hypothetical protein
MSNKSELHVSQTGDKWEVEANDQSLAQAGTKEEAIDAAKEEVPALSAGTVVVHTSDGKVEKEIAVGAITAPVIKRMHS